MNMHIFACPDCPIKDTPYCHKRNPDLNAPKYTRSEKNEIRKQLDAQSGITGET